MKEFTGKLRNELIDEIYKLRSINFNQEQQIKSNKVDYERNLKSLSYKREIYKLKKEIYSLKMEIETLQDKLSQKDLLLDELSNKYIETQSYIYSEEDFVPTLESLQNN